MQDSKFNVGDIVSYNFSTVWTGGKGIITAIDAEGDYKVKALEIPKGAQSEYPNGDHSAWSGRWLVLAKPAVPAAGEAEARSVSSTGAEKGTKPERFELIPVPALTQLARMYARGAEKYHETCSAPNWRKGYEWSKSYAAMQRHANQFWSGEDIDEETQLPHMAAVAFHAFSLLTFMEEHREFDDRYKGEPSTNS